jgi:hypothetical protein
VKPETSDVVVVLVFFVPRAIVPAQAGSTIKMKEGCARMEKSPGKELAALPRRTAESTSRGKRA